LEEVIMSKAKPKDKRLALLKSEVAEFEQHVKKETDPKLKAVRRQQLARAQADLAKYLQNQPKE
jgi:hypothetical protein